MVLVYSPQSLERQTLKTNTAVKPLILILVDCLLYISTVLFLSLMLLQLMMMIIIIMIIGILVVNLNVIFN